MRFRNFFVCIKKYLAGVYVVTFFPIYCKHIVINTEKRQIVAKFGGNPSVLIVLAYGVDKVLLASHILAFLHLK